MNEDPVLLRLSIRPACCLKEAGHTTNPLALSSMGFLLACAGGPLSSYCSSDLQKLERALLVPFTSQGNFQVICCEWSRGLRCF